MSFSSTNTYFIFLDSLPSLPRTHTPVVRFGDENLNMEKKLLCKYLLGWDRFRKWNKNSAREVYSWSCRNSQFSWAYSTSTRCVSTHECALGRSTYTAAVSLEFREENGEKIPSQRDPELLHCRTRCFASLSLSLSLDEWNFNENNWWVSIIYGNWATWAYERTRLSLSHLISLGRHSFWSWSRSPLKCISEKNMFSFLRTHCHTHLTT